MSSSKYSFFIICIIFLSCTSIKIAKNKKKQKEITWEDFHKIIPGQITSEELIKQFGNPSKTIFLSKHHKLNRNETVWIYNQNSHALPSRVTFFFKPNTDNLYGLSTTINDYDNEKNINYLLHVYNNANFKAKWWIGYNPHSLEDQIHLESKKQGIFFYFDRSSRKVIGLSKIIPDISTNNARKIANSKLQNNNKYCIGNLCSPARKNPYATAKLQDKICHLKRIKCKF